MFCLLTHLSVVTIMILYLLGLSLQKQRTWMSHDYALALSRTLVSMSREHEVISQALPIARFKPETSTSQALRSKPMTTRPITPLVIKWLNSFGILNECLDLDEMHFLHFAFFFFFFSCTHLCFRGQKHCSCTVEYCSCTV